MISTVTTTTVTTIVTLASTGVSIGAIATILLLSLLGTQETVAVSKRRSLKMLGKYLNVSILPLLLVFTLIVVFKAVEIIA
jgi:hypothetical protein